jgi:hypothetical protein
MTNHQDTNKSKNLNTKVWLLVIVICLLFVSCTLYLGTFSVHAQTPATDSAAAIRDSVKQKVTEELAQIKKGVAKKGFIGSITSATDAKIVITTLSGASRNALVVADTTVKLLSGGEGTPGDLKTSQYILAMGDVDSQNDMTTKRLLVVAKPEPDTRTVVFGTITKSTTSSFTIGSDTFKFTASTKFSAKAKATDLVVGSKVVAIIDKGTASRIQIVAVAPSATPVPIATVSATPKP